MNCKINRNAAKELTKMLEKEENQGKMVRVSVTHIHGDHAHYEITFDQPTDIDEVVHTDKGIDVILEKDNDWLDGVWIQFFYVPQPEFVITNPKKGHHHHH